ncbi:ATP-binding protein, partial [Pseudomonas aeruginosa]
SEDALAHAHEPFFTTKTTAKGLGLGLAICDNLLRALGGRLEMGNHLEGGAVVRLHLLPGVPGVAAMPQEETRA